jgi:hypothetical protein
MQIRAEFEGHFLALLRHNPALDHASVVSLEQLCQQQLSHETASNWHTFWSLATHFFQSLRLTPGRHVESPEVSAATQVLNGLVLRDQLREHDKPIDDSLQVINHLLFLEQADFESQRLERLLCDWAETPDSPQPEQAQWCAQSLAQLAQEVSFPAVQEVAEALVAQLERLQPPHDVSGIKISMLGSQEVCRLLQHFAVGSMREPQTNVLAALRGE